MADSKTIRYADHQDHFREHFRSNYKDGERHTYGDYEAGYRSGFRYGTSGEHAGRDFDALEPEMRRRYENEHGSGTWAKVKAAARHAFERGRSHRTGGSSSSVRSGKRSTSSGSALSASGSSETASGGPGSAMREGGFDAHRKGYQRHHRETHEGDRDFSAREPAYRHGHRYGSSSEHAGRSYDDLQPEMRRSYEEQHGTGAWAKVKDAVRHAFGNARSGSSARTKRDG